MRSDITLGSVKVRLELIPILLFIALLSGVRLATAILFAIFVHEAGHFGAARLLGARDQKLVLQMTGAGSYVRNLESRGRKTLVLLAGPLSGVVLSGAAYGLTELGQEDIAAFGRDVLYAAVLWTGFQLSAFPPLDGGQILQLLLSPRLFSATAAWRMGWGLGLGAAIVVVLIDPAWLEPVILLTGMALILGRADSGYVRHVDAYAAWSRGDHAKVLQLVRRVPDYLDKHDRAMLLELGLFSAIERNDLAAIEEIAPDLPPCRPVVLAAVERLLSEDREPWGPKLAERALDAIDAEVVQPSAEDCERLVDLAFRYAIYEARHLRLDSALGLLERALDLGFRDIDRLRAHGDLRALEGHPRWLRICARLESDAPLSGS